MTEAAIIQIILQIFGILLFFFSYKYRHFLYAMLRRSKQKKTEDLIQFVENKFLPFCSIRFNKIYTSILIPIVATFCLWGLVFYYKPPLRDYLAHPIIKLSGVLFAPTFEEIFARGIILGITYIVVSSFMEKIRLSKFCIGSISTDLPKVAKIKNSELILP